MVSPKAYGPNQILHDIAALRGQVANLQQNGTFNNITVTGITSLTGQLKATGGTAVLPSVVSTDVWTYVTPPTNYTGTIRYKMRAWQSVKVNVTIVVPASAGAGTLQLFAMGANYTPAIQQRDAIGFVSNGTPTVAQLNGMCGQRWQANPNGTFNVIGFVGGASGSGIVEISFNCEYDLDQ